MSDIYYEENDFKIINGNSLEVLKSFDQNSVDTIITDPPYGLTSITKRFGKENSASAKYGKDGSFSRLSKGFMGKQWDGTGIEYNVDFWKECLKVLKPGGYLLAFGGTRTFHRIACAIEDAGFEIRDTLMWLFGCGFPKSHNVGLAIDKKNGCSDRGHRIATASRFHPDGTFEPNGEKLPPYQARTKDAEKYVGYGTALKPAYEPIIMARKPIENTVADNMLKYGVGGINIDECRIESETITSHNAPKGTFAGGEPNRGSDTSSYKTYEGRFPANVITDGSDEVKANMPNSKSSGGNLSTYDFKDSEKGNLSFGQNNKILQRLETDYIAPNDEGSACRYYYCAKASKKDRDEGLEDFEERQVSNGGNRKNTETARMFGGNSALRHNSHPTVKPTELMQYLIRLVAPNGATILDPFCGSGSTGKAVMFENRERNKNYKFIGIELEKEYLPIIVARIKYAKYKYEYDEIKKSKEKGYTQTKLF